MSNACYSFFRSFGVATCRPSASLAPFTIRSSLSPSLSSAYISPVKRLCTIANSQFVGRGAPQLLRCRQTPSHSSQRRAISSTAALHSRQNVPSSNTPRPSRRRSDHVKIPFDIFAPHELSRIFGQDVDLHQGNAALRILHNRRVVGTLVDKGVEMTANRIQIPRSAILKALEWLREKYPVDERAAAQAYAAGEAEQLERTYMADAQKWGIHKDVVEDDQPSAQTGTSVLDEWKKYNEEQKEAKKREYVESGQASKDRELALTQADKRNEIQIKRQEQRAQLEKEAYVSGDDTEIPHRSAFSRLWPSTVFAIGALMMLTAMAAVYKPPPKLSRLFPEVPTAVMTLGSITAITAAVLVAWRVPRFWRYMNQIFLVMPAYPKAVSLLFNILSHRTAKHWAVNMLFLWVWGLPVHEDIGRGNFVTSFLAGGIIGAACSLYFHVLLGRLNYYSCGASGGIFAIAALHLYLTVKKYYLQERDETKPLLKQFSSAQIKDFVLAGLFLLQIPAHLASGLGGLLAMHEVDTMAHVGGAISGIIMGYLLALREEQQNRIEAEQERMAQMTNEELLAQHLAKYEERAAAKRREENAKPKPTHKASFVRQKD